MATVLWKPEINALTTPQTWRPRYVPRNTNDSDNLAGRIAQKHPSLDKESVKMTISALVEEIGIDLINGDQSYLDEAILFRLSLSGRLDTPDASLPPVEEAVGARTVFSRSFIEELHRNVRLERLPYTEKLPVIASSEDTVLGLADVLNPNGALRLTGTDLSFHPEVADEGCLIRGTRSGSTAQSRFVSVSDTEITLLPDVPAQDDPWNNEYTVSVSTHYTEHGTLRTGNYSRRLRTPLTVPGLGTSPPPETGILTGSAAAPYAVVRGGSVTADETLRIQAVLNIHENRLYCNLLDMQNEGREGDAVSVTANGDYSLPGFDGSAVSSLEIRVDHYLALWNMIRNDYSGRLVDVLVVQVA